MAGIREDSLDDLSDRDPLKPVEQESGIMKHYLIL